MTCIVGVETEAGAWIGGDSFSGHGNLAEISDFPKVFERGDLLFGICGSWRMAQVLFHQVDMPARQEGERCDAYLVRFTDALRGAMGSAGACNHEAGKEMNPGALIVACRGRLYEIDGDFTVVRHRGGYCSNGAGCAVALGALAVTPNLRPKRRVKTALRAAARHNPFVRKPWTVEFQPCP